MLLIQHALLAGSFHRNRVPLLIILAGTSCLGKSTLATKVSSPQDTATIILPLLLQLTHLSLSISWPTA